MEKRTSWAFTTRCCGRVLYRPARPPAGTIRCHHCETNLPHAAAELVGGVEGSCPKGHATLSRNIRGTVICLTCSAEASRKWRQSA